LILSAEKMKKRNFGRRSKLKKVDIDSVLKRIKNASKVLPNSDTKEMSYATTALTTDTSKMIQSHNASHSNHYPEISSTGYLFISNIIHVIAILTQLNGKLLYYPTFNLFSIYYRFVLIG